MCKQDISNSFLFSDGKEIAVAYLRAGYTPKDYCSEKVYQTSGTLIDKQNRMVKHFDPELNRNDLIMRIYDCQLLSSFDRVYPYRVYIIMPCK